MVIPKIVEILETVEFVMPTIEGVELVWNEGYRNYDSKPEQTNKTINKILHFRNLRYR
jgi:hypothetical protein